MIHNNQSRSPVKSKSCVAIVPFASVKTVSSASSSAMMGAGFLAGDSLLFFILALAICRIRARRELRSLAAELSLTIEDPEIAEPATSVPFSFHSFVLISGPVDSGFSAEVGDNAAFSPFLKNDLLL